MTEHRHEMHKEIEAAKVLRAHLKEVIGDDDETLRDMLEGETSLHELIEAMLEDMSRDIAYVEGLKAHIAKLGERKSRLEDRIATFRQMILTAMDVGMIRSKETALATITVKALPPQPIITDEGLIPSDYWIPQDPKLDKKTLARALKAEAEKDEPQEIPGARLDNGGQTVQIKWS